MSKFENLIIKAIKNPKSNFFKKYKVSDKKVKVIKEGFKIKKKYGRKTTRSQAIKRGFKSQLVFKNNNKTLLGS
jgi:hypothetical protein